MNISSDLQILSTRSAGELDNVCACSVELFIRKRSITETQRAFRRERSQQEAPSSNAIRRAVRQWREEGSVTCKKPPGRSSSVRTPDITARVLASISRSPRRTARKHAQAYIWLNQLSNTTNLWWIDVYYIVINYMFRRLWPSSC